MIVISKHCWAIDRRWSPSKSTCTHSWTVLQVTSQEITGRWQVHRRRIVLSSESTRNVTVDSSVSISVHTCCHLQRTTCPAVCNSICVCCLHYLSTHLHVFVVCIISELIYQLLDVFFFIGADSRVLSHLLALVCHQQEHVARNSFEYHRIQRRASCSLLLDDVVAYYTLV